MIKLTAAREHPTSGPTQTRSGRLQSSFSDIENRPARQKPWKRAQLGELLSLVDRDQRLVDHDRRGNTERE
jgi:hypothetical protein